MRLPFFKKRLHDQSLTAVVRNGTAVSIANIARDRTPRPRLTFCEQAPLPAQEPARALRRLVEHAGLARTRCTTLLDEQNYQLLLVEAPDVRPEELRAAVRWRVKDLINFHIDDAVIDVFDIPGQSARGQNRLMYTVAARAAAVREIVDALEEAHLALDVIDIPEMALRNIAALAPEDTRGCALLHLEADHGIIVLTRQHTLYLARTLDIGYTALERAGLGGSQHALLETVTLEIQRSLDYYESHFNHGPSSAVLLAPLERPLPVLEQHLRENLSVPVRTLDVGELLETAMPLDAARQARCLLAIGAALRREERAL